jgi:hypothetical protein
VKLALHQIAFGVVGTGHLGGEGHFGRAPAVGDIATPKGAQLIGGHRIKPGEHGPARLEFAGARKHFHQHQLGGVRGLITSKLAAREAQSAWVERPKKRIERLALPLREA